MDACRQENIGLLTDNGRIYLSLLNKYDRLIV
jgi:hypothetical protein